jgi:hypothetical protein
MPKSSRRSRSRVVGLIAGFIIVLTMVMGSLTRAKPTATPPAVVAPYTMSVFASSVPGSYTQPDSIAFAGGNVFVGFGNGVAKDGSDGKSSTIVEYSLTGTVIKTFSVPGHNDGLKLNPETQQLWAVSNEDGNPALTIIDLAKGTQANYTFAATAHGGGYDDVAFRNGNIYLSASNPAHSPNTAQAIVRAQISGTMVTVTPVLMGNATATNVITGASETLNLQDPDSMIFNGAGDLVLTSQADSELIIVRHPGAADQKVYRLPIAGGDQVDDTVFASSSQGMLLMADRDAEVIYQINRAAFAPGQAYSAGLTTVGKLDFDTGIITPIVTGLVSPHGMAFIDVPDFSIAFDPSSVTVSAGSKVSELVNINRQGGLSGAVAIAPSGTPPTGFKILTSSVSSTVSTATVEIKVKHSVAAGIYALPFTGTDSTGRVRSASFTVIVQ